MNFEQGRTAVRERIRTPEFSSVVTMSRRRRQRHQLGGAAAIAAVALAGGTVVATQVRDRGATTVAAAIAAQPWRMAAGSYVSEQFPLDDRQSYAIVLPARDRSRPLGLAHTTDAGKTWQRWEIPAKYQPRPQTVIVLPKGHAPSTPTPTTSVQLPTPLVLDAQTVMVNGGLTRDGGRTWQDVPDVFGERVDTAENGWVTVARDDGQVVAIDPATGLQHPYRHQPGIRAYPQPAGTPIVTPAKDGSLWVSGESTNGSAPAVAVSHDAGRTWVTTVFTSLGDGGALLVASFDGRTGYAFRSGRPGMSGVPLRAETTDGGQTWSAFTPVTGLSVPVGLAVTADDALLSVNIAGDRNPAVVSRDGGKTFTTFPAVGMCNGLRRTVTGGLVFVSTGPNTGPDIPNGSMFSSDGRTFTTVPMPPAK